MSRFRNKDGIAGSSIFLVVIAIVLLGAGIVYIGLSGGNDASTTQSTSEDTTSVTNSTASSQWVTTSSSSSASTGNGTSSSTSADNSPGLIQIPMSSTSTSDSSTGLELSLNLTGFSNGTLRVSAEEYNPRSTTDNVSAADEWSYSQQALQGYSGSCSNAVLPVGIAVFKGFYVSNSFASAEALTIFNGATPGTSCSATSSSGTPSAVTSYGFSPSSNFASVYTSQGLLRGYTIQLSDWTSGSWTGIGTSSSPQFTPFPNGNYTVVAGDEWGQVVLLHFGVVRPSAQPDMPEIDLDAVLVGTATTLVLRSSAPTKPVS
jgi:hypothetical protein